MNKRRGAIGWFLGGTPEVTVEGSLLIPSIVITSLASVVKIVFDLSYIL